jgi:hypothetical protein
MAAGNTIISKTANPKRALNEPISYLVSYAMEGVLTRGTAKAAKIGGFIFQ